MKAQKIQKGGLFFDCADQKGVLVKSMEQWWGYSNSKHEEKKERMIAHNVLTVCKSNANATFRSNIQNVLILVSGISYSSNFISLCTDKILTLY